MKANSKKTRMVKSGRAASVTFTMEPELKDKLYRRVLVLDLSVSRYLRRVIIFEMAHPEIGVTNVRPVENYEEKNKY